MIGKVGQGAGRAFDGESEINVGAPGDLHPRLKRLEAVFEVGGSDAG